MDLHNSVGIACESRGRARWRRAKGENWDSCNRMAIKIIMMILYFMLLLTIL